MSALLAISRIIDAINASIGRAVYWLILVAVLISAGNATSRYMLNIASNAWIEAQWYLFSAVFLLCSGYALLRNDHVRIDVIIGRFSKRTQTWIDIFGTVFFLLPMAAFIMWLSWPAVVDSFGRHEMSGDAGGLVRWPVKLLIPVGFFLLTLQGLSELIKRVAFLTGHSDEPMTPAPSNTDQPA